MKPREKTREGGVLEQAASDYFEKTYGVSSYQLKLFGKGQASFDALDKNGKSVMNVQWRGISPPDRSFSRADYEKLLSNPPEATFSIVINKKGKKLEIAHKPGIKACLLYVNGVQRSVDTLTSAEGALVREMSAYTRDFFTQINVVRVPLNPAQKDAVDAICYTAGICSSIWPIGTLICGPTAVGCIVIYLTQEQE